MAKEETIYVNLDKKSRAEAIVAGKETQEISVDTIVKWAEKIKAAMNNSSSSWILKHRIIICRSPFSGVPQMLWHQRHRSTTQYAAGA